MMNYQVGVTSLNDSLGEVRKYKLYVFLLELIAIASVTSLDECSL